jgi:hypothetical protein
VQPWLYYKLSCNQVEDFVPYYSPSLPLSTILDFGSSTIMTSIARFIHSIRLCGHTKNSNKFSQLVEVTCCE